MSSPSAAGMGHPLDAIFRPASVAVIGASAEPRKRGNQVLVALRQSGYAGAIYPVNPKGGEILGMPVYTSVDELPETPDLALICTPAHTVPDAVEACGRRGVGGVVVLAVGFKESGEDGAALEARLLEVAREHGVRVVGPNTSGILNLPLGLNLIGARGVRAGSISILVQSGNMALALMNEVTARSEEGIAVAVGVGNELDVGFHEYLDFLGHHEGTRAIVCYVEGFRDARTFLEVAARVTRIKPVLVIKGARSESGRAAARSHTGAVSGEYDRLRAGLRQADVVEIQRTDELLHVAETLATQPPARAGKGIAILSDGGGQGTLAADALSDMGIPLAEIGADTAAALRELLGGAASVRNPVDLAGAADSDPEVFAHALSVLARDPGVGGVLLVGLFGGYGIRFAAELAPMEEKAARAMAQVMGEVGKPLVVHTMYATHRSPPLVALGREHVPVVESLEVACRCIGETWRRAAVLSRPAWRPDGDPEAVAPSVGLRVNKLGPARALERAREARRSTLLEPEARALLSDVGMPFPPASLCTSEDETVAAVLGMKTAVAMKVVSAAIPHKSDAGGVELGIGSAEGAALAFRNIRERSQRYLEERGLEGPIEGVLVSPMMATPVAEMLVGAHRDPDVGPVLTIGAGGIWVEVLRDVCHRVLPVTDDEIRDMLGELRTYGLIAGGRGRPSGDVDGLVAAARSVARCITELDEVEEVEVNPLFVYQSGVQAVDARIFLRSDGQE